MQDGLLRFKIPVRCPWGFLQTLGLLEWVRFLELRNPIDVDLHRSRAEGERVRVPDHDVYMFKLLRRAVKSQDFSHQRRSLDRLMSANSLEPWISVPSAMVPTRWPMPAAFAGVEVTEAKARPASSP